jgi:hypothetical protein
MASQANHRHGLRGGDVPRTDSIHVGRIVVKIGSATLSNLVWPQCGFLQTFSICMNHYAMIAGLQAMMRRQHVLGTTVRDHGLEVS